jgi:cell division protein FtsW (lipid II flippase)
VAFADGTWPSNRWAVLGAEVSAQITEFIITRFTSVFAASIVRREEREFNNIFLVFAVTACLF